MSDNSTNPNPFDAIIEEFTAAENEAAARQAEAANRQSAALQAALAKKASERTAAERKAVAAQRRELAEAFVAKFQAAVVAAGRTHTKGKTVWSKQDFLDAQALTLYLTSNSDARLTVRPRQSVLDVTMGIFEDMFKAQRKLPRDKSLPDPYFQGGRDILARKPKQTGKHVGSQSQLSQSLGMALPADLRPEGWRPPKQKPGGVVLINRHGKREEVKVTREASAAS